MKTLKRLIFSFTIANLVNKGILYFFYYYRRVTRGRRGRGLFFTFLKIGRKCVLILVIYGLNFLFKMQFLTFSRTKNPKSFPGQPFVLVLLMKSLSKCHNSKKSPLPWQIPGYTPVL